MSHDYEDDRYPIDEGKIFLGCFAVLLVSSIFITARYDSRGRFTIIMVHEARKTSRRRTE